MSCFIVDKEAILHLAEIFEEDPKRCDEYNRICHKLLEYMDLIDKYRVDEYDVNEELKPIVQSMQKAFENLPPNFESSSTNMEDKSDNVLTFLMRTYPREDGGNEINDAFRYRRPGANTKMTVFDAIAIINRSFALIGAYTTTIFNGGQIYIPRNITSSLQLNCQSIYRKYRSYIEHKNYGGIFQLRVKILSFLIDILRCIYTALVLFDNTTEKQREISECPLVLVLMPKILIAANALMELKTFATNERDYVLKLDYVDYSIFD